MPPSTALPPKCGYTRTLHLWLGYMGWKYYGRCGDHAGLFNYFFGGGGLKVDGLWDCSDTLYNLTHEATYLLPY
jgi:hypothetical protein